MKLSVAIPTSSLSDETTKLDKTRKISILARACAIFHVETIYVYSESNNTDKNLLVTVLRYLETPQFLRKQLFPKMNELKFAGVLHPLKIPSHVISSDPKKIMAGDIREGIILNVKGKRFVDVGINHLISYFGKQKVGRRVTVQFKSGHPNYSIKEISKNNIGQYWGYMVKERSSLQSLLTEWQYNVILATRKGKQVTSEKIKFDKPILVVFGSPDKDIHEICNVKKIQNAKQLNFFPNQATETVRLEEAVLGTLSILNLYDKT